jgi:tetratricopeptide (TPR) repeat protein
MSERRLAAGRARRAKKAWVAIVLLLAMGCEPIGESSHLRATAVTTAPASAPHVAERAVDAGAPSAESIREAQEFFIQGEGDFEGGRVEDAARDFGRAYALAPMPQILFNLGVCYEKLGRKAEAIAAFKGYLAAEPEDPSGVARKDLEALEGRDGGGP